MFKIGDMVQRKVEHIDENSSYRAARGVPVKIVDIDVFSGLTFSDADGGEDWCAEYFELVQTREQILEQIASLQKRLEELDNPTYTIKIRITKSQAIELEEKLSRLPYPIWLDAIMNQVIEGAKNVVKL